MADQWLEVQVQVTNEAVEAVSNIFHEYGAGGVAIEDSTELLKKRESVFGEIFALNPADYPTDGAILKAYFLATNLTDETVDQIQAAIEQLPVFGLSFAGANSILQVAQVKDDWETAWKEFYHPVKITEQLTIVPSWEDYTPSLTHEKLIYLDPGMAFGTGTHATTILAIQALEKYLRTGDKVYDVGTGSGILAIAAAKLGAGCVDAMDLDEVAVRVAEENVALNQVSEQVRVFQNDLLKGREAGANLIVANIVADIILLFVADAAQLLHPNGIFVVSGIIEMRQNEVQMALESAGFEIIETNIQEDWHSFVAKKKVT